MTDIAAGGAAILITLHDLNLASLACDRLLLLTHGEIVAKGSPAEVLTRGHRGRSELGGVGQRHPDRDGGFVSELGKSRGWLAPNEFWYFWRRFLPFQDLDWLPDEELFRVVDQDLLGSELTSLTTLVNCVFSPLYRLSSRS